MRTDIKINYHYVKHCDLRCKFCFANHSQNCSDEQIIKTFTKLTSLTTKINLVGGEVFINIKLLKKLVEIGKSKGVEISLVTNGFILSAIKIDQDIKYILKNVSMIGVSVDSFNRETNLMTGRTNNKLRTLNYYDLLRIKTLLDNYNVKFKINTVVTKINKDEDYNEFIRVLNPFKWKFFQVVTDDSDYFISDDEFDIFKRNIVQTNNLLLKFESSELLKKSYLMCNENGMIYYDDQLEKVDINDSTLHSLEQIVRKLDFNIEAYNSRYVGEVQC